MLGDSFQVAEWIKAAAASDLASGLGRKHNPTLLDWEIVSAGAWTINDRSWTFVLLAGTPNLRRQLLADCCSRAWGMDVKTAFHCYMGH